jgi:hypothetical protein
MGPARQIRQEDPVIQYIPSLKGAETQASVPI